MKEKMRATYCTMSYIRRRSIAEGKNTMSPSVSL